jgi:outer membrane protein insertion porin family
VIDMQGSTLIVRVTENPILNRVAFEGNKKVDDDKLRDEVQSKPRQVLHPGARAVRRRTPPHRSIGAAAATTPSSSPRSSASSRAASISVFEIDEGDVTGIKRISFVGNEHFSDGTLRGRSRHRESAWWRFLSSDDRFDPDRLNLDRELLRKYYLSEGLRRLPRRLGGGGACTDRDGFLHHLHDQRGRALQVRQDRGHVALPGARFDTLKSY